MPANIGEILQSLDDAVTLKPVYNWISDSATEAVDDTGESLRSKSLERWDIDSDNLFRSLGIFSLVFLILIVLIALYILAR